MTLFGSKVFADIIKVKIRSFFPGGTSGEKKKKKTACHRRGYKRHGFDPWVGKISWRRKWQPTPVFLLGESLWTEEPGELQSIASQSRTQLKRLMHAR